MTKQDDWLTAGEAAELIGCSATRVRFVLNKGYLKGRRHGRAWMIKRADATKYRDSNRPTGIHRKSGVAQR